MADHNQVQTKEMAESILADETTPEGAAEGITGPPSVEERARRLAEHHTATRRSGRGSELVERLRPQEELLTEARRTFVHTEAAELADPYVAEWLLDNFYVVQQVLRQIREDLPQGYYRQLPKLDSTSLAGYPRIYALAREIVQENDARTDLDRVRRFVNAYQKITPLTMGEIWALPTTLRLAIVDVLTHAVADTLDGELPYDQAPAVSIAHDLPADTIVGNAILSLRALSVHDWKIFFEDLSLVHRILKEDPAGVYGQMDFDTRDRYREVIEELAAATERSEVDVARRALDLARSAHAEAGFESRTGHIGYYLVDEGHGQLEAALGYRPPWYVRLGRWPLRHPIFTYQGTIAVLTLLILMFLVGYAQDAGAHWGQLVMAGLLAIIPAVSMAVSLTNRIINNLTSPRLLPRMDFDDGIPADCRTMVVVPTLLSDSDEVESLLRQLELHYLRNADPHLGFALVTDFVDAPQEHMPGDEELLAQAKAGIRDLNAHYGQPETGPFYLFHRKRLWNPGENTWMGWERKRGKLEELNHLILGEKETTYTTRLGDVDALPECRFVITLDADTNLPQGSAARLVGTLAHPLNQARFDSETEQVVAGYTVLQPRTEINPTSANRSRFARIFAGDTGLDLYTHATSDVYQDLFGEGIFVGKGIYDVAAFQRSLEGRVPENTLLSHDLFEGIQGRAGLVTDIVLYEDYPPSYLANLRRVGRWIRGDWQLLPWLLPQVPHEHQGRVPNSLSVVDRWKILDNLRRSLLAPAVLAVLAAGWLGLPGSPWVWTLVGLLTLALPLFVDLFTDLVQGVQEAGWPGAAGRTAKQQVQRWLLAVLFLPYESLVALDAILTTLGRMYITRRRLLQWTTAARTARIFGSGSGGLWQSWTQMAGALFLVAVLGGLVIRFNPPALWVAVPFLVAWLLSPQVAHWISQPLPRRHAPLSPEQNQALRRLARRTWLFFEQFVGPDDHWLSPDHFQESPRGLVAHRTSPTNVGLMLLSTLAAYDLGYVGLQDLAVRLGNTFATFERLERHRGHFLNWYDTRTLDPLPPRYVSSVDSGNLAGCLVALRRGCLDLMEAPILHWRRWQGLLDTLGVPREIVAGLAPDGEPAGEAFQSYLDQICQQIEAVEPEPAERPALLRKLIEEDRPELERRLLALVEADMDSIDAATLRVLRVWFQRIQHHLTGMQRELETLAPWIPAFDQPPDLFQAADSGLAEPWQALYDAFSPAPTLDQISRLCAEGRRSLRRLLAALEDKEGPAEPLDAARSWCQDLSAALENARSRAEALQEEYHSLANQAEAYAQAMEFGFLFHPQRRVFHIGYNVDAERPDDNYYDLLASEARIASLVAIAKGDVPQRHWLHLGRPLTEVKGMRGLLSWSGTMFEYLMPPLLMRQYENTLLEQSVHAVVQHQMDYGAEKDTPWGISESGYYHFDNNQNYQYRAFGVPGLGFKRGLGDDLVVSPYASLLALFVHPQGVMDNLQRLNELGMLGDYGYYEAIDYTPVRMPTGQEHAIVRSYMVHHQGMILLSLVNHLQGAPMVGRFHADPRIQSVELLLQEQIPYHAPLEESLAEEGAVIPVAQSQVAATPWRVPVQNPFPHAHYLSNGHYGLLITSAGAGYSRWNEQDLTRWSADAVQDDWGTWIYLLDQDSGALWSAAAQPTATSMSQQEVHFYPHQADFQSTVHDIATTMEVVVAPESGVEIRRLRITNQGDTPRRLRLCSYGEVVLAPQEADRRHPAFNKLFIQSEYDAEANALLFWRRARSAEEEPIFLAHALVVEPGREITGLYEGDRSRFLGRGGSVRHPAALRLGDRSTEQTGIDNVGLSNTTGGGLDSILALAQDLELDPHTTAEVTYLTAAGGSRQAVVEQVKRYRDWTRIQGAFDRARAQSEMEMRRLKLTAEELERIQKLFSLLIYPNPALRADAETLAANCLGQPSLWPYAISGDYPILLVRIENDQDLPLVRELLRAHTYWRNRGLQIDLVILNQKESGYAQELQNQLQRLLTRTDSDAWLNRRGGIFLVQAGNLDEANRVLLATAARVVLDAAQGSLADQLQSLHMPPARLPAFVPTRSPEEDREPTPAVERPTGLRFDNGWGGFTPDGREYVIYLEPGQWTPAPWVNVIANPDFGFLVSEAGGGYSWAANSGENRLTPWRNDPVEDEPGEALYLRDEETATVWSPTPLPARAPAPYLVRHGAGYTVFEHNSHGLEQQVRLFVAPDAPVKIVQLRLKNLWQRVRRITATYYAEWVLGPHRHGMQQYVIPEYEESGVLLARNPYHTEFGERVAFLAASQEPHGLTAERNEFLGPYGNLARPAALARIGLAGTVQPGPDPCAVLQLHVDLEPGEVKELCFVLGQGADRAQALQLAHRYREQEWAASVGQKASGFWDDLLGTVQVETPDEAMDLMLNRWLLYQDLSSRVWGRSAFYQSSGAYGFRDQLQDVMAVIHAVPEVARAHILRAARHQFEAGDVLHWWHPPSGRGVRTHITDDLLWLPYVVTEYVTTSGDDSILDETAPFLVADALDPEEEDRYGHYPATEESYTIYEHCRRAIEKGSTAGRHGLPLIGGGDWNDGMNRVGISGLASEPALWKGRGESVWLGWFLHATLTRFACICEGRGDEDQAEDYRRQAQELQAALEEHAWDGEWYRRAFYHDGAPLGSAQNQECQIDAIAQSWAVLSGAGRPERVKQAMAAVDRRLVREEDHLVLLFTPPFDRTPRDPGYIKGYPPGIRENGGQYTHAAIWTVWAFAELGQGKRAEELFRLLNPIYHGDTAEKATHYRVEPYVVAADVYGAPPHTGRGGWTWYTGSGGWLYRLGLEAILGLRREGDTLRIEPCIPPNWQHYTLTYRFGKTCYCIQVQNPDRVSRGVQAVTLDGEPRPDGRIPLEDDGKKHEVQVRLG